MAFLSQIDTSTLSNQNLTTALLVHTFTNTTRVRKVYVGVDLAQIAGNGSYSAYVTIQRAGAGNAYQAIPITTTTVASGQTVVTFLSVPLILNTTDVLKVYVLGLAGDTTTPDTITYVWEEWISTDSSGRVDLVDAPNATAITAIQDALPTAAENATALLDASNGIETSFTLRQAMRLMLASLAGKLAISGNTVTIRDVNDSKDRIVATTDADGQRTAVTKDVS